MHALRAFLCGLEVDGLDVTRQGVSLNCAIFLSHVLGLGLGLGLDVRLENPNKISLPAIELVLSPSTKTNLEVEDVSILIDSKSWSSRFLPLILKILFNLAVESSCMKTEITPETICRDLRSIL
jgi:hypothetical protein